MLERIINKIYLFILSLIAFEIIILEIIKKRKK